MNHQVGGRFGAAAGDLMGRFVRAADRQRRRDRCRPADQAGSHEQCSPSPTMPNDPMRMTRIRLLSVMIPSSKTAWTSSPWATRVLRPGPESGIHGSPQDKGVHRGGTESGGVVFP